jgi:hypothetical protein
MQINGELHSLPLYVGKMAPGTFRQEEGLDKEWWGRSGEEKTLLTVSGIEPLFLGHLVSISS